ncbi:MAG: HEPN domain-containing protein [Nitrososphaeria archaeon]
MVSRANDWLKQAIKDLEHARRSLKFGDYEWACFAAQQASEKAVKALFQKLGIEVWGHSVYRLLDSLPDRADTGLIDMAKELDKSYIASRYPNSHPEGSPMDYYTEEEARRLVGYAEKIIEYVKSKIV